MLTKNNFRRRFFRTQKLNFPPSDVFPLLCPVREYDWIEHWNCDLIYTDSGFAEENCVFTTKHDKDNNIDIWVVSKYNPPYEISFVRTDNLRVINYNITLKQKPDGTTSAEWEQILTGLNKEGNLYVEGLQEIEYEEMIDQIEKMLNHYLEFGEKLLHNTGA